MPPTTRHESNRNKKKKQHEISISPDFSVCSSEKDKRGWFREKISPRVRSCIVAATRAVSEIPNQQEN